MYVYYLFIYLFVCLFVYLFDCLFVYLFIYLFMQYKNSIRQTVNNEEGSQQITRARAWHQQ